MCRRTLSRWVRRRVLNGFRARGEVGAARSIVTLFSEIEIAAGRISMRALAVGHDRDRAFEPGILTRCLIGVEECCGTLYIVIEHAVRLRPAKYVRHSCLRVPGDGPDTLQDPERKRVASWSIENGAGLEECTCHHRVPVDVGGAIDERCP